MYKIYSISSQKEPNIIRYIGVTKQSLNKRLQGHLWTALHPKSQSRFMKWMDKNQKCNIVQLEMADTELQALELEDFYITKHKDTVMNRHVGIRRTPVQIGNNVFTSLNKAAKYHKVSLSTIKKAVEKGYFVFSENCNLLVGR